MGDIPILLFAAKKKGEIERILENIAATELDRIQVKALYSGQRREIVLHCIGPHAGLALSTGAPFSESAERNIYIFATPGNIPGTELVELIVNSRERTLKDVATLISDAKLANWIFQGPPEVAHILGARSWV